MYYTAPLTHPFLSHNSIHDSRALSSTDTCGNTHTQGPYYVRYDAVAPVFAVTVLAFTTDKCKCKYKWDKLPVGVTVTETCTANSLTRFTAMRRASSRRTSRPPCSSAGTTARGVNRVVNGWDANLYRFNQATKSCSTTDFACDAANGCFHAIRVCSQDLAGAF